MALELLLILLTHIEDYARHLTGGIPVRDLFHHALAAVSQSAWVLIRADQAVEAWKRFATRLANRPRRDRPRLGRGRHRRQ